MNDFIQAAQKILRGERVPAPEVFALAKQLADGQHFDYARRLAEHVNRNPQLGAIDVVKLRQKWALWTSKDPDQPEDTRHDEALAILNGIDVYGDYLRNTKDPESLGIAGGIWKRKWFADGQIKSLDSSLRFYMKGYESGVRADDGYTGINAAFVLDLLAHLEQTSADSAGNALPDVQNRREQARVIRQDIVNQLVRIENENTGDGLPRNKQWWFLVTVAEAYLGLGQYEGATDWLTRAMKPEVLRKPWEFEATARQLAWLARLKDPSAQTTTDFERSSPWQVLRKALGAATAGAASLFAGKAGLALSGGGFRASFFHLGVLAALADLDVLRHIEVFSCVSGGSILGAYYYLEIRDLLRKKADAAITEQDYIQIVRRMCDQFLEGAKKNLRTRVVANIWHNLKMAVCPGYTQTTILGRLMEKHLFARVEDADTTGHKDRLMKDLKINPPGTTAFNPKYDNWQRFNKVPILILNATTLNTGHNWQFTASWMGEPPVAIDRRVDRNDRLRRMYYEEAPGRHSEFRLGRAVAASACVPGLFAPLELRNLYPGTTVRLVDGGVHDNQGIFGLLDQNCTVLLVSDASGQMSFASNPGDGILSVPLRSNSVLMARVRIAEFRELEVRNQTGRIKEFMLLHLKNELEAEDIDWVACDNPKRPPEQVIAASDAQLTHYGIIKSIQEKLAAIRTDLDSFNDIEAFALMASGYRMTLDRFGKDIHGFVTSDVGTPWKFLAIMPQLSQSNAPDVERVRKVLDISQYRLFKAWRLSKLLSSLALILVLALLLGTAWACWTFHDTEVAPMVTIGTVGLAVLFIVALATFAFIGHLMGIPKTANQIGVGLGMGVFGLVPAWVHLYTFDLIYKWMGSIDRHKSNGIHSRNGSKPKRE